eukprot:s2276_g11.t1
MFHVVFNVLLGHRQSARLSTYRRKCCGALKEEICQLGSCLETPGLHLWTASLSCFWGPKGSPSKSFWSHRVAPVGISACT